MHKKPSTPQVNQQRFIRKRGIILTGQPGCGKTTLVDNLIKELVAHANNNNTQAAFAIAGFITREVKAPALLGRIGFDVESFVYGKVATPQQQAEQQATKATTQQLSCIFNLKKQLARLQDLEQLLAQLPPHLQSPASTPSTPNTPVSSQHTVGKYNVYLENFESTVAPLWAVYDQVRPLVLIIDEVGKMECCSEEFCKQIERCLAKADDSVFFVFTLAKHGKGLMGMFMYIFII